MRGLGITGKLFGVLAIFGVPCMLMGAYFFVILFPRPYGLLLLLFISILVAVYAYWLLDSIPYAAQQIKQITIPDVDEKLTRILKSTDEQGDLINREIILIFHDNQSHTRNQIQKALEDKKIELTRPTVDKYVSELVKNNILSAPETIPYNTPFTLTATGKLCLGLVKTYFPDTTLFFLWRHYIGAKSTKFRKSLES